MNGEAIDIAKCPARSLSEIAYLVCRGGWPVAVGQHGDMALERAQEYYEATVETDISKERNRSLAH